MKLYYDMLLPYMPDSIKNDDGEYIQDGTKVAGRQAMLALSSFQNKGDVGALYQAVLFACNYVGEDLVDIVLDSFDGSFPADDVTIYSLVDDAATALFKSIKSDYIFDIRQFASNVLTAAHYALIQIEANKAMTEAETEDSEKPVEEIETTETPG